MFDYKKVIDRGAIIADRIGNLAGQSKRHYKPVLVDYSGHYDGDDNWQVRMLFESSDATSYTICVEYYDETNDYEAFVQPIKSAVNIDKDMFSEFLEIESKKVKDDLKND